MSLPRKYSTRTGILNFPPGVSPADQKGVDFAEDAIKALTNADDVKVSFDVNAQGQPLLHRMNVELFNSPKQGQFLNTAGIEGDVAKQLGDLIEALADGGDASSELDALQQKIKGDGDKPEDDEGEDKEEGEEKEDKGDNPFDKGSPKPGGDAPDFGAKTDPTPGKDLEKKTPFAGRNSRKKSVLGRAMKLEKEYEVPIKEGAKLVRQIDKTANAQQGLAYLRREIRGEDNQPLDKRDYIRIAEILSGEKAPTRPLR